MRMHLWAIAACLAVLVSCGDEYRSTKKGEPNGNTNNETIDNTNGETNGQTSGGTTDDTNGGSTGDTNGESNGGTTGDTNGATNGETNGDTNGETNGEPEDCPTAIAKATAGGGIWETTIATIPLQTIQFSALDSTAPDGSVASYEWTILQQPTDSTTQMQPNGSAAEPSLFLDLAGQYEVELKVYDNNGMESCDSSVIIISVVPDAHMHVEMVWDTLGDPDQTDDNGTDVDLHLLHQQGNGVWAQSPWDCYYANKFPSWGASLDIDDTNGAGPEVINLASPEVGVRYAVGVHYWRATIGYSGGQQPSYVTVRIYIDGIQMFEEEQLLNNSDDFWHVADIQDRVITPIGTLSYL